MDKQLEALRVAQSAFISIINGDGDPAELAQGALSDIDMLSQQSGVKESAESLTSKVRKERQQSEAPVVPDFIVRSAERAIDDAIRPKGMSLHDGKARIDASHLRKLLDIALAASSGKSAPVAQVVTLAQGRNAGKQVQLLRDLPNGTKLYEAPGVPDGWRPSALQLSDAIDIYDNSANNGRPELGMKKAFEFLLSAAPQPTTKGEE